MPNIVEFTSKISWNADDGVGTASSNSYSRNHEVKIENKVLLEVSAAKEFKGDSTKHNPEDLLLSAVASCHMMSYFYVCVQNNIVVLSYKDEAKGTLIFDNSGKGNFKEINLYPEVVIENKANIELAESLHKKANELCFIANSCNFPIHHFVEIM